MYESIPTAIIPPPREFTFQKKYGQISDGAVETHCQIPNGAGNNIVKCPYLPRTFPI
jgi:hypothetical protein